MMKNKRQKTRVLRQVLLLMTAQTLAIASMIWGGSLSVDAGETLPLTAEMRVADSQCQDSPANGDAQTRTIAKSNKPANAGLLDFSIGKPWG